MEHTETYYQDLITRYFSGEATSGEMDRLEAWLKSRPENRQVFDEYRRTWLAVEKDRIASAVDLDGEWEKLQERLYAKKIQPEPASPVFPSRRAGSGYRSLPIEDERPQTRFNFIPLLRIAAIVLVLILPGYMIYRTYISPSTEHYTAENKIEEILLPDGTIVTLNSGSSLDYPAHFVGSTRDVTLNGEAYFKVAHRPSKPFILSGDKVRIRVLGTSFNVNTREKPEMLSLVLTEGMVSVYFADNQGNQTTLVPGEKATVTLADRHIVKSLNPDENYMAWKTRRMVFTDQALDEVVMTLNHVYRSDIRLQTADLGRCRLTATFDHQSLASVLNVVKSTLDLSIINTPRGIVLSGKGCK